MRGRTPHLRGAESPCRQRQLNDVGAYLIMQSAPAALMSRQEYMRRAAIVYDWKRKVNTYQLLSLESIVPYSFQITVTIVFLVHVMTNFVLFI